MHRLYSSFQLPKKYTETWEDIEKVLKDLSWTNQKNWQICVWNADKSLKDKPELRKRFLDLIEGVIIPYWSDKDGVDFRLYLAASE